MRSPTINCVVTLLLGGTLLAACDQPVATAALDAPSMDAAAAHGQHAAHPASAAPRDLAAMRAATARYQQFEKALADGFVPLSGCVAVPWGGMGYHYGHPDRLANPDVDPGQPEVLLYEPMKNGRKRLVGVEFMVHGEAWYAAGNTAPPAVAGRTFDDPNPNHPDPMVRPFYTLHAWIWRNNPDGMFAHFNPQVSCAYAD